MFCKGIPSAIVSINSATVSAMALFFQYNDGIIAQLSERTEHNLEKTYEDKQIILEAPPCHKKWKNSRS